jgi:hypothetical protein
MDFGTSLALWLGIVALAVAVTPRIVNRWVAATAWLMVTLYAMWLFGSRQTEAYAFFAQQPQLLAAGIGGLMLIGLLLVRVHQRRARNAAAESEAARQRDFDSFPVELGIVDHGVNIIAASDAALRLFHQARPPASRIHDYLFIRVPEQLPAKGDPDHAIKKQAIFREAAIVLRDDVFMLEEVAAKAEQEVGTFTQACRAIFQLPVSSDGDAKALGEMRSTYGRAAVPFDQVAAIIRSTSERIGRLQGNQQDLSRVVIRTTRAMERLATTAEGVSKFFSVEVATTIDRKLQR